MIQDNVEGLGGGEVVGDDTAVDNETGLALAEALKSNGTLHAHPRGIVAIPPRAERR